MAPWQLSGALFVAGGVVPSLALHLLREPHAATLPELLAVDAAFVVTALAFLALGELYGRQQFPEAPPYLGAWMVASDAAAAGRRRAQRGRLRLLGS